MVGSGYEFVHLKGKDWLVKCLETEPGEIVTISAEDLRHGGKRASHFLLGSATWATTKKRNKKNLRQNREQSKLHSIVRCSLHGPQHARENKVKVTVLLQADKLWHFQVIPLSVTHEIKKAPRVKLFPPPLQRLKSHNILQRNTSQRILGNC